MDMTKLAEVGYSRYYDIRDGKTFDNKPMPKWEELPGVIQAAWVANATGVLAAFVVGLELDDREMAKIFHALIYKKEFSNAGVSGHSDYLLLAKIAEGLGLR